MNPQCQHLEAEGIGISGLPALHRDPVSKTKQIRHGGSRLSVIPVVEMPRLWVTQFQASLDYMARPCL